MAVAASTSWRPARSATSSRRRSSSPSGAARGHALDLRWLHRGAALGSARGPGGGGEARDLEGSRRRHRGAGRAGWEPRDGRGSRQASGRATSASALNRSARLIVSRAGLFGCAGHQRRRIDRCRARCPAEIDLRSGDGTIRGRELSGDVKAQTGDGSIRLHDVTGSLDIGTGDGSIVARRHVCRS